VVEAVVSAILIFSISVVSSILYLMAELAAFSDICTSAVFSCVYWCCRWNLYGSECTDISGELLSTFCISLSTETEVLLLLETAACRSRAVAVVINRLSADNARVRRHAVGGALMTFSAASSPLGTADRRSVNARIRVDWSWRCAVL